MGIIILTLKHTHSNLKAMIASEKDRLHKLDETSAVEDHNYLSQYPEQI